MLLGHETPINKRAAMIIQKAPWWAQPLPEKQAIINAVVATTPLKIEDLISTTNPPPPGVEDRRGLVFNGITVLGYADSKDKNTRRTKKSSGSKKPKTWVGSGYDHNLHSNGIPKIRYWWVIKNNEIFRAEWRVIKLGGFKNITSKVCAGCLYDKRRLMACDHPEDNSTPVEERKIKIDNRPVCYKEKI